MSATEAGRDPGLAGGDPGLPPWRSSRGAPSNLEPRDGAPAIHLLESRPLERVDSPSVAPAAPPSAGTGLAARLAAVRAATEALAAPLEVEDYVAAGPRAPRPERGILTRPTVREIGRYRRAVDERVQALLRDERALERHPAIASVAELGLSHEQQHQELILADVLHLFSRNPLEPVYRPLPGGGAAPRTGRLGRPRRRPRRDRS